MSTSSRQFPPFIEKHQLRYYISLSAPPTRTPVDGTESFIRPEIGFNPSWFHKFCDIDFSRQWHIDPEYRLQSYEKMRNEIKRRFPGRNIGGILNDQPPDLLTGVYGAAVISAVFGQQLEYYPDKWPAYKGDYLSDEDTAALKVIDWNRNPVFEDILRQLEIIENLTGSVRGFLNWQGVLNMAFRLRGQQIFIDLIVNPSLAHHLFEVIAESLIQGIKAIYARQKQSEIQYEFASIGNCVVNMLSPQQYSTHVLPFDLKIRSEFKHFGIHNCAWNVDPYIEAYATVPNLGYIDMGLASDLNKIRELLPHARRNVLYTCMDLVNKPQEEIRNDIERIAQELAPCDIGLPDLEMDVPDDRVIMILDWCEEMTDKYYNL